MVELDTPCQECIRESSLHVWRLYWPRGGRVEVTLTDGTVYEVSERFTPGTPTNPVDERRLNEKFLRCVESVADRATAERLAETIESFDAADTELETLTKLL